MPIAIISCFCDQMTVIPSHCPLLHTHRCIEQMPEMHFASNLFCLFLTQQPRCPSHISVASAWQCGVHRSDRMFHRTHAGAYVHFSRILPNDEKTSKKWPFFGQKLSFLASDKRLMTIFLPKSAKKGSFLVKN